jgi:hypothetical protein
MEHLHHCTSFTSGRRESAWFENPPSNVFDQKQKKHWLAAARSILLVASYSNEVLQASADRDQLV